MLARDHVALNPVRVAVPVPVRILDGPSIARSVAAAHLGARLAGRHVQQRVLYLPLGFCIALAIEPRFGGSQAS